MAPNGQGYTMALANNFRERTDMVLKDEKVVSGEGERWVTI